jgi:hypothetical protein
MTGEVKALSDTLDEYLARHFGITTSHTHPQGFRSWLRDNGYVLARVPGEPAGRPDLAEAERRYREQIDRRQAPWGEDAEILLAEYDRRAEALARLTTIAVAAEAYRDETYNDLAPDYTQRRVLRKRLFDALDAALADALAAARGEGTP